MDIEGFSFFLCFFFFFLTLRTNIHAQHNAANLIVGEEGNKRPLNFKTNFIFNASVAVVWEECPFICTNDKMNASLPTHHVTNKNRKRKYEKHQGEH